MVVKRMLFTDLCDMIAVGRRFNHEEVASIQKSEDYRDCTVAERHYVDELLRDYTALPSQHILNARNPSTITNKSSPI